MTKYSNNKFLQSLNATSKRRFRENKRAFPWSFFIGGLLAGVYSTLFSYLLFQFGFNGKVSSEFAKYTNSTDYMGWIVIGISLTVLATATLMHISRVLIFEIRQGTFEVLIMTPCSRWGYHFGILIEQLLRAFIEYIPAVFLGIILGAKFNGFSILNFILCYVTTIAVLFNMSIFLGAVMVWAKDTYLTQNTFFLLIFFLTGMYFPTEYLPATIEWIKYIIPLYYAIEIFRAILLSVTNWSAQYLNIIFAILTSLPYAALGFIYLIYNESKIVEQHTS